MLFRRRQDDRTGAASLAEQPQTTAGDTGPVKPPPNDRIIPIEPLPSPERKGRLDEPGLLEAFDEDADFDRDPELERTVRGEAGPARPKTVTTMSAGPIDDRPLLVKAGWDDPRIMAGFGGAVTLAALIATWITTPATRDEWLSALLVLYGTALHTGTGVVAVILAAVLTDRAVGRFAHAGARMFLAVAVFQLVFHLNFFSTSKTEEVLLATVCYMGVVAATFRLKRDHLVTLAGCHFGLWLVTWLGMWLSQLAAAPVKTG
jgi:hypothetical protein